MAVDRTKKKKGIGILTAAGVGGQEAARGGISEAKTGRRLRDIQTQGKELTEQGEVKGSGEERLRALREAKIEEGKRILEEEKQRTFTPANQTTAPIEDLKKDGLIERFREFREGLKEVDEQISPLDVAGLGASGALVSSGAKTAFGQAAKRAGV